MWSRRACLLSEVSLQQPCGSWPRLRSWHRARGSESLGEEAAAQLGCDRLEACFFALGRRQPARYSDVCPDCWQPPGSRQAVTPPEGRPAPVLARSAGQACCATASPVSAEPARCRTGLKRFCLTSHREGALQCSAVWLEVL